MKEILAQYVNGFFKPQSEEDHEIARGAYKKFQLVKLKITTVGAQKQRSVAQLNTLMACLQLLADNTEDPQLNSKEKAKFSCKVYLDFRYHDRVAVRPDGTVVFEYRSFSFKHLKHMEACNIFERAFEWIAGKLGLTVEEMIKEAQSRMRTF